jgi:ABC-2 type transport system permease protein
MSWLRLRTFIIKELQQLRRDPEIPKLILIAPLIQLLIHAWGCSLDLQGVKLGVIMEDRSREARQLVQAIEASHAFVLVRESERPNDMEPWLRTGVAQIAIHIPPDFSRTLSRGGTPVVQVLSDGSDSNTATLAFQYLSGAASAWAGTDRQARLAMHPERAMRFAGTPQVEIQSRFWYNPDLKSLDFVIPGVMIVILITLPMSQTSIVVVRERELGTLEQLSVTPVQGAELMIAKTVPSFLAALATAVMLTLLATLAFGVPIRGSLFFYGIFIVIFLLNSMGMGLVISILSKTQMQAQLLTNFTITPMILMSGFLFPIANMPKWLQPVTLLLPSRYGIEVVRGVFLKGQGFAELWPQVLAVVIIGTVVYGSGVLLFKKRVD